MFRNKIIMKSILLSLVLFLPMSIFAQSKFTISGYVKDKDSGEEQIGATVYVKDLETGTSTNVYGFYSLTIPEGEHEIMIAFLGYNTITRTINLTQSQKINFELEPEGTDIQEVIATTEAEDKNVESLEMSTTKISINTIRKIPALMGEVDVIKAIQLLPGVQTVGEGGSGFYVRGGGVDQNLIILDEATVYNASHLMGFFSVFNSDIVKDVKLYKGGIPAEYGGRLSSVLDIRMKEGNKKKYGATGGIGTISSRLTLEGPIKEDKASFIVSGRRTYGDLALAAANDTNLRKSQLYFYDLNTKLNWNVNENNKVFVSGYFGRDVFSLADLFGLQWGNATVTSRWTHIFNDKLFLNVTGLYSNFDYFLGSDFFEWKSNIRDFSGKADFEYYPNPNNKIKFGGQSIRHTFNPGDVEFEIGPSIITSEIQTTFANEHAAYVSNEHKISKRFSALYGLRWSLFQNTGKYDHFIYDDQSYERVDSVFYNQGVFNSFSGFEPRLGLKYTLTTSSSVKLSYNRMRQYLHLASNSTSASPLDIWIPSSPNVKPQIADQVAVGYFRNFKDNAYEGSVELYYKFMNNSIDFRDHAQLLLNPYLEGELRFGVARAYGAEWLIRKQKGRLTGWLSYTLARSERQIESINNGLTYPTKYDKRHDLSLVAMYDLNERWDFGTTLIYSTGAAVTTPIGRYEFGNTIVPIYSSRNGARMPPYHRLDLSATLTPKRKDGKEAIGEWVFSVYNTYLRKNPYVINFTEDSDNPGTTKAEMVYLFSIIPSITYNFKL